VDQNIDNIENINIQDMESQAAAEKEIQELDSLASSTITLLDSHMDLSILS
jgi:hypothetical protein